MFSSLRVRLARFGRWPRRLAALICLLCAAATAMAPKPAAGPLRPGLAAQLHSGEVAVPVAVDDASYLHPGDRVGVVATAAVDDDSTASAARSPTLVADRLRVLSVRTTTTVEAGHALVLLAVDRTHAVRLSQFATSSLRLLLDHVP